MIESIKDICISEAAGEAADLIHHFHQLTSPRTPLKMRKVVLMVERC
jgi:hypothetical protein